METYDSILYLQNGIISAFQFQDRLHDELDKVFCDDDRQASYDDVERLVYLDQVLKETQRRYTFLPCIFRNVDEDCRIG